MAKEDERPRSNRGKGELPCVSYQRGDGEAGRCLGEGARGGKQELTQGPGGCYFSGEISPGSRSEGDREKGKANRQLILDWLPL